MAREQFPGKSNSLDALCRRLEVDNSGRDLHGALIDADLLAQVYLAMTRGQDSLVIDAGEGASAPGGARGLAGGAIYTADGHLAVSVVQEGLVRVGQR